MTKEQLKSYLVEEAEYAQHEVDSMTAAELIDAYLAWNGIRNFTDDILKVVKAVIQPEKVWVVSYLNQTYSRPPREIYGVYASEELANKAADEFEESMNEDGHDTEELEIEIEECIVEYNL